MKGQGSNWGSTFTPEQRAVCNAIFDREIGPLRRHHGGMEQWTVFMVGTTGPPRYIELRKHDIDGRLIKTIQAWPAP